MAKQLNIDMHFNADTSKAKQAITDLQQAIQKLGYNNAPKDLVDSAEFEKAANAARELAYHLNNAYNAKTGNLDLSKLNNSLKQSGTSLEKLTANFKNAGETGQQAFISLANGIAAADQPAITLNSHLSTMFTTLKNVARFQLSSSIMHGLIGGMQTAFNYAKDLNESLNNIRIVTGQSTEQMARFADQANKTARALSSTTLDYTKASLIYYQQGLSDAEVKARADVTVKLANVSRQSAQEVSDQMTAIWNNFDTGAHSMEYFADVITSLGATTASSSKEIAIGLEKFAPIAGTIGLSYEKATAALATLVANTRQSAETVGTGLRTIFSRLESLKLGETLEDGVDLSKYTKAMKTIGVDVLDANGKLKEMDTILDQVAERWQQLDNTQKTAFATTVGGVRQYTNLMALFENWGDMQTNLQTALNSEGSLQTQADTFAEGWEAARDRVKTALQSIYQDLLDDNFFISITKGFETILSGIDSFIDKIGGVKTILISLASFIGMNIANKIGPSIQKMIQDIQILTGGAKSVYASMQKSFSNQVSAELASGAYDSTAAAQLQSSNALLLAKTKLSAVNDQLSASEKMQAQLAIQGIELQIGEINKLKASIESYQKKQETANNAVKRSIENLSVTYDRLKTSVTEVGNKNILRSATSGITDYINSKLDGQTLGLDINQIMSQIDACAASVRGNLITALKDAVNSGKSITEALSGINKINLNQGDLANFFNNLKNISVTGNLSEAKVQLAGLQNSLQGLDGILPGIRDKIKAALTTTDAAEFNNAIRQIQISLQNVTLTEQNFTAIFKAFGASQGEIDKVQKAIDAVRERTTDATEITKTLEEEFAKLGKTLGQVKSGVEGIKFTHFVTGTEIITTMASAAGSFAMSVQSLKSIFKTLNDEDMSWGEKLTSILMSISLITPGVINMIKAAGVAKTYFAQQTAFATAASTAQMVATQGLTAAENKEALAAAQSKIAHKLVAIGFKEETAAKAANILTTKALTNSIQREAAINELSALGIQRNTAARMVNAAASNTQIGGIGKLIASIFGVTAAEGAQTAAVWANTAAWLSNPWGWLLIALAGVVTAIVLITKHLQENTDEVQKAKTISKDFSTSLQDIKTYAEEVKQSFDGYDDILEKLENCDQGTKAWRDTVKELAEQTDALLEKYPVLAKYASMFVTDEATGLTYIPQEVLDKVEQDIQNSSDLVKLANAYAKRTIAEAEAEREKAKISETISVNGGITDVSVAEVSQKQQEFKDLQQQTLDMLTNAFLETFNFTDFLDENTWDFKEAILKNFNVDLLTGEFFFNAIKDNADIANNLDSAEVDRLMKQYGIAFEIYHDLISNLQELDENSDEYAKAMATAKQFEKYLMQQVGAGAKLNEDYLKQIMFNNNINVDVAHPQNPIKDIGNIEHEITRAQVWDYVIQSLNLDEVTGIVEDNAEELGKIEEKVVAKSIDFSNAVANILQGTDWFDNITHKTRMINFASEIFSQEMDVAIKNVENSILNKSLDLDKVLEGYADEVYGGMTGFTKNDANREYTIVTSQGEKTINFDTLISWKALEEVMPQFQEKVLNVYNDALGGVLGELSKNSTLKESSAVKTVIEEYSKEGSLDNLSISTLEEIQQYRNDLEEFLKDDSIATFLDILNISIDDFLQLVDTAAQGLESIPEELQEIGLNKNNITVGVLNAVENKFKELSIGPYGKALAQDYLSQILNTINDNVSDEQYNEALSRLLTIDINDEDALKNIKTIFADYNIIIDDTDQAWIDWINHIQSGINILPPTFENLKTTMSSIIPILSNLKFGDIIKEEDYNTLVAYKSAWAELFMLQADGSHRFLGNSQELTNMTIESLTADRNHAQRLSDLTKGISNTAYFGNVDFTQAETYDSSMIRLLYASKEGRELLQELNPAYIQYDRDGTIDHNFVNQLIKDPERYQALVNSLTEAFSIDYLGQISDFDQMIASTATSLEQLNKIYEGREHDNAYTQQLSYLKKTALESCDSVEKLVEVMKEFSEGGQEIDPNDENFVELLNQIVTDGTAACNTIEELQQFYIKMSSIPGINIDKTAFTEQANTIIKGKIGSVSSVAGATELKNYINELSELEFIDQNNIKSWLAELALAGYTCKQPFEEMKTIFSDLVNVVANLKFGDTISDEAYQKLIAYKDAWKELFITQSDGSHEFIGNAEDMEQFTLDQIEIQKKVIQGQKDLQEEAFNLYRAGNINPFFGQQLLTNQDFYKNTDNMRILFNSQLGKDILGTIDEDLLNLDIDSVIKDYTTGTNTTSYNQLISTFIKFFTTNFEDELKQTDEMTASTAKTLEDLNKLYEGKEHDSAYEKQFNKLKKEAINAATSIEDLKQVAIDFGELDVDDQTAMDEQLNKIITDGAKACETIDELIQYTDSVKRSGFSLSDESKAAIAEQASGFISKQVSSVSSEKDAENILNTIEKYSTFLTQMGVGNNVIADWLVQISLAGYNCIDPLKKVKTTFSDVINVTSKLKIGDTISDDAYQKLISYDEEWAHLFLTLSDGTHELTKSTDSMLQPTINSLKEEKEALIELQNLQQETKSSWENTAGKRPANLLTFAYQNQDVFKELGLYLNEEGNVDFLALKQTVIDANKGQSEAYNNLVQLLSEFYGKRYDLDIEDLDEMRASMATTFKELKELKGNISDEAYEAQFQRLTKSSLEACETLEDFKKVFRDINDIGEKIETNEVLNNFMQGKIGEIKSKEDIESLLNLIKEISNLEGVDQSLIQNWLAEIALSGYKCKTPFEELKQIMSDLVSVSQNLKFGDIISDEAYQKLVAYNEELEHLFITQANGSHQFIGNAEDIQKMSLDQAVAKRQEIYDQQALRDKAFATYPAGSFATPEVRKGILTNANNYKQSDFMGNFIKSPIGQQILSSIAPELITDKEGNIDTSMIENLMQKYEEGDKDATAQYQELIDLIIQFFTDDYQQQIKQTDEMIASTASSFEELRGMIRSAENPEGFLEAGSEAVKKEAASLGGTGLTSATSFSDIQNIISEAQATMGDAGVENIMDILPGFEENFNRVILKEYEACKTFDDFTALLEQGEEIAREMGSEDPFGTLLGDETSERYEKFFDTLYNLGANSVGGINDISKQYNLTLDQQTKAYKKLASTTEEGKKILQKYEKELKKAGDNTEEAKKATEKFKQSMKDLQANKAATEIRKLGSDMTKLKDSDLDTVAEQLQSVFGKGITSEFVKNNKKLVNQWLNGTDAQRQAAADSMQTIADMQSTIDSMDKNDDLLVYVKADGSEVKATVDDVETFKKIIAENPPTVDVNGHADMSQIVAELMRAGMTAETVANLLASVAQTNVNFAPGSFNISDFPENGTPNEVAAWMKEFSAAMGDIRLNVSSFDVPSGGKPDMTTGGGGGGGGGNKSKKHDKKEEDKGNRYRTIRAKIEDNDRDAEKARNEADRMYGKTRIDALEKEIKLKEKAIDLQRKYIKEIKDYLKTDKNEMEKLLKDDKKGVNIGIGIKYDENGVITNYDEIQAKLLEIYNKYANKNLTDEQWSKFEERWNRAKDAIEQYIETRDLGEEEEAKLLELINERYDAIIDKINEKITLHIEVYDDELAYLDYQLEKISDDAYQTAEAISLFGDQTETTLGKIGTYTEGLKELFATHGMAFDLKSLNNLSVADLIKKGFTQAEIDYIKEYRDGLLEANKTLTEMRANIIDKVIDTFDQLNDKVNESYELFDHYTNVLENYKDITDTLGRHINAEQRKLINDLNKAMLDNSKSQLQSAKAIYDNLLEEQKKAKEAYDEALLVGDETSAREWEKILDSVNEATRDAQETWLDSWQETTEQIQSIFELMLEQIVQDFDQALSGAFGSLDYLDEAYDRRQETNDLYLDDYDKLYELNKKQRDLNKALSDQNLTNRREMLQLQKDMNAAQESGVKLSQYDLDVFEKRFELLQAYNDLQIAQNAKNQVRLQRDNEGNWGYVYTANEDKVAEAEQAYEDKLHEYQKLNDDYIKELQEKAQDAQKTYRDTLKEIISDITLTDEEREARIQELNDWYLNQQQFFEEQANHVFENQASTLERYLNTYKTAIDNLIDTWEETSLADLTGLTSLDDYMNNWINSSATFLEGLKNALQDRQDQVNDILNITGTSIEDFGNQTETAIQNINTAAQETVETLLNDKNGLITVLNNNFNTALEGAVEWEKEYAARINDATEANEAFISSINRMIGALNVLSIQDPAFVEKKAEYDAMVQQYMLGLISEEEFKQKEIEWQNYLQNYQKTSLSSFDTGGYTGSWGSGGKLGILHEKEQIFNAEDTSKILEASQILKTIDLQILKFSKGLGEQYLPSVSKKDEILQQEIHITAEFPNAVNHLEIEEAFNNLANKATQYANRKT